MTRTQILVQDLDVGTPVVFRKLLEGKSADTLCCGTVSENGCIAYQSGREEVIKAEDVEILDYYQDGDGSVNVYPIEEFIAKALPGLNDGETINFTSNGSADCNFGIGFQHIFETKVLVAGYWGGYSMEDETGDIRLVNCSQKDLRDNGQSWVKEEIARQLTSMISEIDGMFLGFLFVKLCGDEEPVVEEVTEMCPECGAENTIANWCRTKDGLTAYCPRCGHLMMLCSECEDRFSWSENENRCQYTKAGK